MALCDGKKYNLCGGGCEECVNIYKKTEKEVSKLFKIDETKYGFEYLDYDVRSSRGYELKLEYVGDDMEYKDEEDFEDMNEWREFRNKQYDVKVNHFEEMLKDMKRKKINYDDYDYDDYDYPCVYIYFKLEK